MFKKLFLTGFLLFGLSTSVWALGDSVTHIPISKLDELASTPVDGSDYFVVFDASDNQDKKLDASRITATRTKKLALYPNDIDLSDSVPPAKVHIEGGTGNEFEVLQFDADGGATGDDHIFFKFQVPDGFVENSLRFNITWSCESNETSNDDVVFDFALVAIRPGSTEVVDVALNAFTESATSSWAGVADRLNMTQLNPEIITIAIDEILYVDFWIDESASEFTDTIDIHIFELEWESTE